MYIITSAIACRLAQHPMFLRQHFEHPEGSQPIHHA